MENYEETNIVPFFDVEEFDCDVIGHSSCICDDSMLLECVEEEVREGASIPIACRGVRRVDTSRGRSVNSSASTPNKDAFKLYNGHAFRLGFSIRKGNQKFKAGCKTKYLKQFYCYKQGMKSDKGKGEKAYTKVDFRMGCKAMIEFRLNDESGWTVSRHDVSHNHGFCDLNQRHFMHSQRQVTKNNTGYLQELKDIRVSIAVWLRVLKKQYAVMPSFTHENVYFYYAVVSSLHMRVHTFILMDKFGCYNDSWLNRLYNLREKCPAFSKDFFSGGIPSVTECIV
ncbi:hypothetical protein M9H77_14182 [Catharanthus roseus]|uniref:Uncharacterized protein n=1 Tax=Catharanthus roseus TaxID=4058 RepID=A0ACC0BMG3_CATRO|nr:hypothetical protein M9H77_14182 [Catharanthus roseus]